MKLKDSTQKIKSILAKGEDMTAKEIKYLVYKEVRREDIAQALNYSLDELNYLLNSLGVINLEEPEGKGNSRTKRVNMKAVEQLQLAGWDIESIADTFDIHPDTLKKKLREIGQL